MSKVKFLDLTKNYEPIREEMNDRIQKILDKCDFIKGSDVTTFENNFASFIGTKYCIGVGNGTDALEIAVQSLGLEEGDEIIVQGNTFIATCLGVLNNGLKLVLCDCDADTHMIDLSDLERKITSRTKCIIVVHLYGGMPNMDKVLELCDKYDIILIEDAAQAHGASWDGKKAGSFGRLSCFSFYPGKNLGAYGDGGAICTDDLDLSEKIRKLSNLGCKVKYHHEMLGRNSRLDTIQAAVLDVKLKYLVVNNEKRNEHAKLYMELLEDVNLIELPKIDNRCYSVFHLFVIKTKQRDELKCYLESKGIGVGMHYPIAVCETEAIENLSFINPNSIINSKQILSLPMYPELENSDISYVCDCIKLFFT